MRNTTFAALSVGAMLLVGLAGCAAPSSGDTSPAETSPTAEVSESSRTKSYSNLAELEADSAVIVTVTVSEEYDTFELNGTPSIRRVVVPSETHKGDPAEQLRVIDFGGPDGEYALVPGTVHLMFLTPFELERGVPTGDYVVTGLFAGDFVQEASGEFVRVDDESPQLPERITVDQVIDLVE